MSEHPPQILTGAHYIEEGEDEKIVGSMQLANKLEELESLKEKLSERIRILKDYEAGLTPTYVSYADIIDTLLTQTEGLSDERVERVRKLAEGRVAEIRSAVRRYIEQVVKYRHAAAKFQRDNTFDTREEWKTVDYSRKNVHDALIHTLRTTGQTIAELQKIAQDEAGEAGAKLQAYPSGKGVEGGKKIFDGSFLDDRDRVRDWAIAAWALDQIRIAKKKATQGG